MGLACSQARLLSLTARKADCEYGISISSMHKMSLTREMSELSQEYYSKLQSKKIAFYNNGKYNKMNYNYLMGYGSLYTAVTSNSKPLKTENSMILTDYKGQVVLSDFYANAIKSVLGNDVMDAYGRGKTFSKENIAQMIAYVCTGFASKEDIQAVIDKEKIAETSFNYTGKNTMTGQATGNNGKKGSTDMTRSNIQKIVDFYYPIFAAAAANGWTTEYNKDMARNEDYVSDALVTGSFQLETVSTFGEYDEGTSLTYFITSGLVDTNNDSETREEITAWYNAEKERISEKETYLDLQIDDLSTELEAINTEIQSVQSLIDDAVSSVFDWGSG